MRTTVPIRITVRDAAGQRTNRSLTLAITLARGLSRGPHGRPAPKRAPGLPRRADEGVAGPTSGSVTVGISDQHGSTFSDPRFGALSLKTARLITPWNSVYSEPHVLDEWLTAARAASIEPLVAFEHARGDRCPESPCRLPSADAYATALRAFLDRYPWVRLITPWNEPNHRSQPTAGAPRQAAAFYNAARAECRACTLVAGDLLDAANMPVWLGDYERSLAETPRVWGLHNYYDTTYFSSAGVRALLKRVSGEVWLTETGGIVAFSTPDGRVALPYDESRAEAAVRQTFDLAERFADRIGRVYLYQWRAPAGARFDAGLISPDGRPRAAYGVLRAELAPQATAGSGRRAGPRASLRRRVRVRSDGYVAVPLACPAAGGATCAGRVTVEDARYRRARLVNGRPQAQVLVPRTRAFEVPGGRASTLPFVLPRPVLREAARRGILRLRITLDGGPAPAAERALTLKAPRHPRVVSRGRRPW